MLELKKKSWTTQKEEFEEVAFPKLQVPKLEKLNRPMFERVEFELKVGKEIKLRLPHLRVALKAVRAAATLDAPVSDYGCFYQTVYINHPINSNQINLIKMAAE